MPAMFTPTSYTHTPSPLPDTPCIETAGSSRSTRTGGIVQGRSTPFGVSSSATGVQPVSVPSKDAKSGVSRRQS